MAGHRHKKRFVVQTRDEVRRRTITEAYAKAQTPEARLVVAYDWWRSAMRRATRRRNPDIARIGAARAFAQQTAEAMLRQIEELERGD